jgi:polysaccharide deacetylase family protein (PEP-CTERM system associated)
MSTGQSSSPTRATGTSPGAITMTFDGTGPPQHCSSLSDGAILNMLTVDVEDWLESSLALFADDSPLRSAAALPTGRVSTNTRRLLGILDEGRAKATFFVLGTVAHAFPDLVRSIHAPGHEVATHGNTHDPVYTTQGHVFREGLQRAVAALEGLTGEKVRGYRAPYASITTQSEWALEVLQDLGFEYDSSIFPIRRELYGMPSANPFPHVIRDGSCPLTEFPFSTVQFLGRRWPVAGGGYFRVLPYPVTRWALRRINAQGQPVVFYLHPYELDTDELRNPLPGEDWHIRKVRLTQRLNRGKTEAKLRRLLSDFEWTSVRDWMANHTVPVQPA